MFDFLRRKKTGIELGNYKALLEAVGQVALVSITDVKGDIVYINDKFVEVSKFSHHELIGKNHRILKSGHQPDSLFRDLWKTLSEGYVWRGEIKNKAKDGSYFWADTSIVPIINNKNTITNYLSVCFLITDKKRGEEILIYKNEELEKLKQAMLNVLEDVQEEKVKAEKLSHDLEKFKVALDSTSDQVVITDAEGMVLYANAALEKMTGFKPEEAIGKKVGSKRLWGGMMDKAFYKNLWNILKVEKRPFMGEITNRKKNKSVYESSASISPILNKKGEVEFFVGIERDITQDKEQKMALARANAMDEAILDGIGDGLVVVDSEAKVILINKYFEELLGFSFKEVGGKYFTKMVPMMDNQNQTVKDSDRIIRNCIKKKMTIRTSGSDNFFYKRKDGSTFPVSLIASPIIMNNEMIGAVEVFRDITSEREIDKAKTEFVSLASHQLKTPLSSINWYTEMLMEGDAGEINAEQWEYLQEIYQSNQRMVELVNALLNVSRLEVGTFIAEPEPTDLMALCKSVIKENLPLATKKGIDLRENYQKNLPLFNLDPKLMRIIMQNLVSNAVKYTPSKGQVNIGVELLKEGDVVNGIKIESASIHVSVIDSGYGIPKKQQDKIFSKLFRADNVKVMDVEGTGLGLYIVKSIIESSGGKIWFHSIENKGTEFHILIPLAGMKKKGGTRTLI